jgi:hypothetical protein
VWVDHGTQEVSMAIAPGTRHPAAPLSRPRAARASVAPTPVPHPVRNARSPWHWLWGAVSLAIGLFIAAAGWIAWIAGPVVTVVALVSLVTRRRWSHPALWIGLGLTLGVVLHVVLGIVRDAGGATASLLP